MSNGQGEKPLPVFYDVRKIPVTVYGTRVPAVDKTLVPHQVYHKPPVPLGTSSQRGTGQSAYRPPPSRDVQTPGKHMAGLASDVGQGLCGVAESGVRLLGDWALEYAVSLYLKDVCTAILTRAASERKSGRDPEQYGALVCVQVKYTLEREGFQQRRFVGGRIVGYAKNYKQMLDAELTSSSLIAAEEGWGRTFFYLWITPALARTGNCRNLPIVGSKDYEPYFREWWVTRLRRDINDFMDDLVRGKLWRK